jgi:hypothetical protein
LPIDLLLRETNTGERAANRHVGPKHVGRTASLNRENNSAEPAPRARESVPGVPSPARSACSNELLPAKNRRARRRGRADANADRLDTLLLHRLIDRQYAR